MKREQQRYASTANVKTGNGKGGDVPIRASPVPIPVTAPSFLAQIHSFSSHPPFKLHNVKHKWDKELGGRLKPLPGQACCTDQLKTR